MDAHQLGSAVRYRVVAHHREGPESAAARLSALLEKDLRAAGVDFVGPLRG